MGALSGPLAAGGPPGAASLQLDPWLGLLLALLLVLLNGFFVAAEFALAKVRPAQVEANGERGEQRGGLLDTMASHLDGYLSATRFGITLASLGLGWIGAPAFAWMLRPGLDRLGTSDVAIQAVSLTTAFALITALHVVFGALAPRSLAIRHPRPMSLWIAAPLYAFYKLTYPVIRALEATANGLLRLVGVQPVTESELAHSEEELRLLLSSTREDLPEQKRELLDNVFELSHRVARQIMVPRGDVVFLSTTRPLDVNLQAARVSGHTRFPLCRGDLDQAIGLIHIKDLFRLERLPRSLEEIARPLAFVPETLPLDELLRRMRAERVHLAAVLDEYGGTSGIVTLENVIEEIVGEIQDEFDLERPELVAMGAGRYRVDGGMLVEDLEDALDLEISERDEDTIGGVVLSELGRRPRVGDSVEVGPLRLRVAEAERNRIKMLDLEVVQAPAVSG